MRKLAIERTYALKQYENLKLFDEIDLSELGLGKEVFTDELIQQFRYLQFISAETAFRNYLLLIKDISDKNLVESLAELEKEKTRTIELIKQSFVDKIELEK